MDFDEYYRDRHPSDSADPTHLWHPRNPVWVAHRHQIERAILRALAEVERAGQDLATTRVLEVGCGSARHLRFLAEVGAGRRGLVGVDLLRTRLTEARLLNPATGLVQGDASRGLPFADGAFDLGMQLVAFSSVLDLTARRAAADELQRVIRPGGWILTYDVVRPNPGSIPDGFDREGVEALFSDVRWQHHEAIHNRLLTRTANRPWLAELVERLPIAKTNLLMLGRLP